MSRTDHFIEKACCALITAHGVFAAATMAEGMMDSLRRAGMTKFSEEWKMIAAAIRASVA